LLRKERSDDPFAARRPRTSAGFHHRLAITLPIGLRTFALVAFIGGATLARRCLRGMLAIALGAGIALSVL